MDTLCREVYIMAMKHLQVATDMLVGSFLWNEFGADEKQRFVAELRQKHSDEDITDVLVTLDIHSKNTDMHDYIVSAIYL